jgi:hypothetical protein
MRRSSDSLPLSRTYIDPSPLIVIERKEEHDEGTTYTGLLTRNLRSR